MYHNGIETHKRSRINLIRNMLDFYEENYKTFLEDIKRFK